MTSKLVVNTIEADTGISSVSFASSISMSSTSKFHFGNAGIDIGADTNINRPATGVLAFNINSSEKVRITSDGKIGINDTTPDATLSVGGATAYIDVGVAGGNRGKIGYTSNDLYFGTSSSSGQFIFKNNVDSDDNPQETGTERLRIGSSGQIGIAGANYGTSGQVLTSQGSGSAVAWSTITGTTINNNANNRVITGSGTANTLEGEANLTFTGSILTVTNSSGAAELTLVTPSANDSGVYFNDGSNAGAVTYNHSDNSMRFRVNSTEKVRITNTGQLLVNTTSSSISSSELFEVKSTGNGFSHFRNNSSTYAPIYIDNEASNNGSTLVPLITFTDGGGNRAGFLLNNSSDFNITGAGSVSFSTGSNIGSATERLNITNTGIIQTGSKTITGGNNLAIQNFAVKGVWSGASAIGKSIELISGYDSSVKMAAVGYNLTDVNLGSTYGGDLTFHTQPLYSSPTTPLPERMRISSSGYITKPDTPCFIVRHSSAEIYSAGSYIDGPWTVTLNRGSHFNTSTGIFTTPVAGLYQLNMMMNNDYASSSRPGNFKIYVNNSLYAGMQFDPLDSHAGWFTHVLTGTLNLSRNDTVRLYTGNAARVDNYNWNHWSMYLVG